MELMPGYKQTLAGVIPDDWQLTWLGAHGETFGGLTGKTKKDFGTGDAQYVTFMNVISNVVIDCDVFDRVHISPAESQNRVRKNDLLFNGSSETPEEVAFCAVHIEDVSDLYLNSFCFGFRLRDHLTIDPLFLAYLFRSRAGRELVKVLAQGSTRYNISKRALLGAPLAIPPAPEQQAIAIALSDMDALLASFDQLIAKKRDLKQAAMQQLLTGEKRLPGFSGDWKLKSFSDLFDFSGGYSASRDQLSDEGHCYLHYGDIHGSSKTSINTKRDFLEIPKLDISLKRISEKSLLKHGDVVFVDASEDDAGTSKHLVIENEGDVPFISGLHTIVAKSKANDLADAYKHYCFQTTAIRQQFMFYAVGTKVSGISKTNIAKLTLPIPSIPEQIAIASVLSNMDVELAALEARSDKTRNIKQAMMQELLTGKTRLIAKKESHV